MRIALAGVVLTLALFPAPVRATEVFSPPMFVPANTMQRCTLANIGSKPLKDLILEVLDFNGASTATSSTPQVEPGASQGIGTQSPATRFLRCRWRFSGSAKKVRAGMCVDQFGCLPAS
jgi:hypothetical protein